MIVVAGGHLLLGEPLKRVEGRRLDAGFRSERFSDLGRQQVLAEDRCDAVGTSLVSELRDASRVRLRSGREPRDRFLLGVVGRSQVAERRSPTCPPTASSARSAPET